MRIARLILVCASVAFAGSAFGHGNATEPYVPIGQSQDSGRFTLQGRIEAIDARTRTLRLRKGTSLYTVTATEATPLWHDRSQRQLTTLVLRFEQLRKGSAMEVRCAQDKCDGAVTAEWIKVDDAVESMPP